jgi:hypothetical protein
MGIGRREFLKICGDAFVAYAAASTNAVAVVDDLYVNRRFGLAFRKPPNWRFVDIKQMGEIAAGQIFASRDFRLTPEMLNWIGLPFVAIQQDPGPIVRFAPSAQFYLLQDLPLVTEIDRLMNQLTQLLSDLPADCIETPPMLTKAQDDAEACAELFKSFAVLEEPAPMTLSACPSATYTAAWLFEHAELATPIRIRVRTIFSLHDELSYLIRLTDSPYSSSVDEFDLGEFVSTIAFV